VSLDGMKSIVVRRIGEVKIFKTVIDQIMVSVMDHFRANQRSTKIPFHHHAMFIPVALHGHNLPIAIVYTSMTECVQPFAQSVLQSLFLGPRLSISFRRM